MNPRALLFINVRNFIQATVAHEPSMRKCHVLHKQIGIHKNQSCYINKLIQAYLKMCKIYLQQKDNTNIQKIFTTTAISHHSILISHKKYSMTISSQFLTPPMSLNMNVPRWHKGAIFHTGLAQVK